MPALVAENLNTQIICMKKFIFLATFAGLLCSFNAHAQILTLGILPAADSVVIENAAKQGLFKAEGMEVKTLPFKSALEVSAALKAGRLDGYFGDLMNVILNNASGACLEVIASTTHTTPLQRHFGLAVSPKIKDKITSLKDLNKTDTAVSSGTIIAYLLQRMRESTALAQEALHEVEVKQIPVRLQMLLSGKIDTALLPEPLLTLLECKGGRVIWDDRNLHEALAVIAVKKNLLSPEKLQGFRRALSKSVALIEADPETYRTFMVEKRLLPKAAAENYQMLRFSLFNTDDQLPPLPSDDEVLRVEQWMISQKLIKKIQEPSSLIRR